VWSLDTKKEVAQVDNKGECYGGLAVSPDGRLLLSGSKKDVKVWHLGKGGVGAAGVSVTLAATGKKHSDLVRGLRFLPSSSSFSLGNIAFVSSSNDCIIVVWCISYSISSSSSSSSSSSVLTCTPTAALEGHSGSVYEMDVSPSGHQLYSCSDDNSIRAWHLRGEEEMCREMVDVLEEVGLFGALEVRGLLCMIATCLVGGDALFEQVLALPQGEAGGCGGGGGGGGMQMMDQVGKRRKRRCD
jgi:WD40 repeat protein